jgi:hypothetical protein
MFDNLRDQSSELPFDEDPASLQPEAGKTADSSAARPRPSRVLGMTPPQRFIIAAMLMLAVCSLGAMCLLLTGKIGF